ARGRARERDRPAGPARRGPARTAGSPHRSGSRGACTSGRGRRRTAGCCWCCTSTRGRQRRATTRSPARCPSRWKPRPAAARRPVPRTEPWRACAGARALPHAPRFAAPTLVRPRSPFTGQSPLRRGGADRTYCRLPTERRVAGRDVLAHAAYAVNVLGGATTAHTRVAMERLPTTRGHLRSRGRSSASRTDPWGTGALRRGQRAWHLDDDSGRPVPAGPHVGDDSAAGQHEPAGQAGHPEQGQLLDVELVPEPAVPVVLVR